GGEFSALSMASRARESKPSPTSKRASRCCANSATSSERRAYELRLACAERRAGGERRYLHQVRERNHRHGRHQSIAAPRQSSWDGCCLGRVSRPASASRLPEQKW